MKRAVYKYGSLGLMAALTVCAVSCTAESMFSYSHDLAPFGRESTKTKELKSEVSKPDTSIKLSQ